MSARSTGVPPVTRERNAGVSPAARRSGSKHAMFLRMLMRAALVQPGRAASALMAVVVAATVATAMLTLYADVQAKLRKEFRNYGANIVVVAPAGHTLAADTLAKVDRLLDARSVAVPFAYAVARTSEGAPIVVAGTDFARAKRLNTFWSVSGAWPSRPTNDPVQQASALIGLNAVKAVGNAQNFTLSFNNREQPFMAAGTLKTGAAEDSRVYMDQAQFEQWTGAEPSSIEIGAAGSTAEIDSTLKALAAALPGAEVRPVRQIVEGEARVLGKTRAALLAAIAIIIATALLCVLATLTTWVLDRRRDFAIMKALGASQRLINGFFAAEAAALGVIGAIVGFALGIGVATWIGRVNFHAAVSPRWSVFPAVLAGSVTVALLSAALPMTMLRRVQPATILRGE